MSAHTPGPWNFNPKGVLEADKRLMNAAPDLLEALQYARQFCRDDADLGYIDAAIAKATGAA